MTIGVNLSHDEVAQIRSLTKIDDSAEAVSAAAREFLRLTRLRELKSISGKVEFDENWQELETREIDSTEFPT